MISIPHALWDIKLMNMATNENSASELNSEPKQENVKTTSEKEVTAKKNTTSEENSAVISPDGVEKVSPAQEEQAVDTVDAVNDNSSDTSVDDNKEDDSETEKISEDVPNYNTMDGKELISSVKGLLSVKPVSLIKERMEAIKQAFYKQNAPDDNNEDNGEKPNQNELENEFKALLAKYKELKAAENIKIETEKKENLKKKKDILKQLEELIQQPEDLSATIPAFRKLQSEWKAIGSVPQTDENPIWKEYNHYQEQFYDLIKINNELREYDFKKNLEAKTKLCELAEALNKETDAVKASQALQKLHERWREIGPVSRELREEIWNRFKEASTVINKKHQSYFDELKAVEEKLLDEKEAICDKLEKMDLSALKTYAQWDDATNEITAYNEKFKITNPVQRKVNSKIFKRYRQICDNFFTAKKEFYKSMKSELAENLEKKRLLCEQAEALKDSEDWKETTEKFIALQKEWKTIGTTARKHSDAVWKRFVTACDYFFEQKNQKFGSKKSEEVENLQNKLKLVDKINNLTLSGNDKSDLETLKKLTQEFKEIGHVPYKEKDKIYQKFKDACDKQYKTIRGNRKETGGGDSGDRGKLMARYDTLKREILTYENNIGFFSSSKKANSIVKDLESKIEKLKTELEAVISKIDALDKNEN